MLDGALVFGLVCVVSAIVGCGIATWLYLMTDTGKIQQRGHDLGLW